MPDIDLSSYRAIQSNLFVRIEVDKYRTTPSGAFTSTVLRFSDLNTSFVINGETYTGLGNLMAITSSVSELRASGGELTITISGIPNTSISEIVNSRIKGCPVRIYRAIFNADTGAFLSIPGNPIGRYRGFVNNYQLSEDWDNQTRQSSNTIIMTCASSVDVLQNKVAGRRTNPESFQRFSSITTADASMNRVPTLENATFDFGAPK